jgi:SAM-dependent methyltransferase
MDAINLNVALDRDVDGIYRAAGGSPVSYPADGHDSCLMVEDESFWFRHRNDCIVRLIRRHPFCGAFLDVGGGNGYVARRLQDEGFGVVLLEPGDTGARNARIRRGVENVVCATIESAGFGEGAFGAIGMFDVIEHVEEDTEFLERTSRLLAPGGTLYLTVPCHGWLWSQADVEAGHFRRYTIRSMRDLLLPRFEINYMSYFFSPLVVPQYLLRALPYRLGASRARPVISTRAAHGTDHGVMARLMARLLTTEASRIEEGKSIGWGASCLVAATVR